MTVGAGSALGGCCTGAYQDYTFDRFGNIGKILTLQNHVSRTRTDAIDLT
ncbi:MAG: hypothetical protein AAF481_17365 [Acidobacteriota bacterium]